MFYFILKLFCLINMGVFIQWLLYIFMYMNNIYFSLIGYFKIFNINEDVKILIVLEMLVCYEYFISG